MTQPTVEQREEALRAAGRLLEWCLAQSLGQRCNFVLVIAPDGDVSYASHITNTPRELVGAMLAAVKLTVNGETKQ